MSALEESLNDQDPDYVSAASNDLETQQKIYEENARNTTARKITTIVEREFSREIDLKEKEILQIQERLHKTLKIFHFLRYVIITNFYNRKQNQIPQSAETPKQTRIHPAIKTLIGKSPKPTHFINPAIPSTSTDPRFSCSDESLTPNERTVIDDVSKTKENTDKCDTRIVSQNGKRKLLDESRARKVPRYVPPKSSVSETVCPSRGSSRKVCKRIIVGNISKWIPLDWREDASSHKWTMYVRGNKDESADISTFVSKVRFFLHPSYRPNDVVEITSYPFHLSRRGWGEFPLRVQLHFKNALNKPMDIIHHLKLDRTYTGLQTLGSETLVDVWIHTAESRNLELNSNNESIESSADNTSVKIESSNSDDSEATRKQLLVSTEISRLKIDSSEEIPLKKEVIDSNIYERSDVSLDLITKLENRVKVEPSDITADALNNKNEINLKETLDIINHDHSYLKKQYSHCSSVKEENITIEHFEEVDCVSVTNVSAVGGNEEKLNNVTVTSNRFNGNIQSSATSNTVNNDSQVVLTNTELQGNISQSSLLWFNANKYLQAENLKSSDTSKILENTSAKDTLLTINGFCKPPDTSLDRLNSLQRAANSSETCNSHLKPLQISIPSPNMFASSTNKHVLLLKNEKMASVDVTSLLTSKSNEKLEGDAKVSIARGSKITKFNVRVPQAVSILKKLPDVKINAQQEIAVNNNKKAAVFTLKSTNSFLLNVNENVPILKIADSRDPQYNYSLADAMRGISSTDKREIVPYPKLEHKTVTQRTKITLGKDKHKIQSKKELYEAILQSIDTANIADTEALIRFIIRRLPIVTPDARDPEYKQLHLYACSSEEEYFAHNIGKQRALEWHRAKTIRSFLRKKLVLTDQLWSIKEIMVWARLHGYTPSQSSFGLLEATTCDTKKLPDTATSNAVSSTCTEPVALQKWLQTRQQESSHQSMDSEVEEIDVESIKESPCRTTIDRRKNGDNQNNENSNSSALIPLELDENLLPLNNFVCDTARDIGIKIGPEEIVPGVLHCSASRVMIRVIECFVEDLTRSSLARAWERNNGNGYPTIVTLNDVRNALINRQEFDIFTNEGLGSRQQLSTTDLSNL